MQGTSSLGNPPPIHLFNSLDIQISRVSAAILSHFYHDTPPPPQRDPPREILPDILGEIFRWVAPRTPLDRHGAKSLVCLMLVCKFWRDVALHTHPLWASLQVELTTNLVDQQRVFSWLAKAGACPKTVVISRWAKCGRTWGAGPSELQDCCSQHASFLDLLARSLTLARLVLPSSSSSCFGTLMRHLQTLPPASQEAASWNSTRHLTASIYDGFPRGAMRTSESIFKGLPLALVSLDLTITTPDTWLAQSRYQIPSSTLQQLRTLRIACRWPVGRVVDILSQCTSLDDLKIVYGPGTSPLPPLFGASTSPHTSGQRPAKFDAFTLPQLRSLDLDISDPADAVTILRRFYTPRVINIRVQRDSSPNHDPVWDYLGELGAFTTGPRNPVIQSLTIYNSKTYYMPTSSNINAGVLVDILGNLPGLSHLAFEKVTFDAKQFLASLRKGWGRRVRIGLRLRTIELVQPGEDFDFEALLQYAMLHSSRARGADALRRVKLGLGEKEYERFLYLRQQSEIVQELQSVGVIVDVSRIGGR